MRVKIHRWMRIAIELTGVVVAVAGIHLTRKLLLGGAISPGMALGLTLGSAILGLGFLVIGAVLMLAAACDGEQ
ncbi:MAG: hypothetical protein U9R15_05175 [Chloroflexota bacterium]|nr:hypothetical protein [Chloroflexota bacterium]